VKRRGQLLTLLFVGLLAITYSFPITETAAMLQDGLEAEWHFTEGSGSSVLDTSYNSNHGTITGATWTTGAIDGALLFDGSDDYVEFDDSASFSSMASEFTLEALVMITSYGTQWGNTLLMMSRSTPTTGGYENLFIFVASHTDYSDRVRIHLRDTTNTDWAHSFNYVLPLNEWVLFDVTRSSTGTVTLYVNGSFVESTTGSPEFYSSTLDSVWLGTDIDADGSQSDFFNGYMDEIRLYSRAISSTEVSDHYEEFFFPETTTETTTTTTTTTSTTTTDPIITVPPPTSSLSTIIGISIGSVIAVIVVVFLLLRLRSSPGFGAFEYG
jgi:hypothetical protein